MGLSKIASGLFGGSSRAKADYTPKELAKAKAYLKKEDFFLSSRSSSTNHRFVKEYNMNSVDLPLEVTGAYKGTMFLYSKSSCRSCAGVMTATTIRDYVKRKDIEATKNPVVKLLKRVI